MKLDKDIQVHHRKELTPGIPVMFTCYCHFQFLVQCLDNYWSKTALRSNTDSCSLEDTDFGNDLTVVSVYRLHGIQTTTSVTCGFELDVLTITKGIDI